MYKISSETLQSFKWLFLLSADSMQRLIIFLRLCTKELHSPISNSSFLFSDFQEPYAVVVLLEKDLVLIDLAQNG